MADTNIPTTAQANSGSDHEDNRYLLKDVILANEIPPEDHDQDHEVSRPPAPQTGMIIDLTEYNYTMGAPLDPPPACQFKSMDDVLRFCQERAKHHGYAVAKACSNANKNVYIQCDQSGDYRGQTLNKSESYKWAVNCLKKHVWPPQVFVTDRDAALHNALAEVFPDTKANLCTWHLTQNIATNCKQYFGTKKKAVAAVEKKALASKKKGSADNDDPSGPIDPWKAFLPGHAYLKQFIVNSTSDFLLVFKALALAVNSQLNHPHKSIAGDTVKTLVHVPKCFVPLLGHISSFAIKTCVDHFKRLAKLDPNEPCSNTVTVGLGIPCAHRISELLEDAENLPPDDFHKPHVEEIDLGTKMKLITMALSNKNPSALTSLLAQIKGIAAGTHKTLPVLAPAVKKKTKGRPNSKGPRLTTTKRNPSAFEIVEANFKKEQMAKKRAMKASKGENAKRLKKDGPSDSNNEESG
ncbi:hypothetical protein PSHT_06314 [Puccinia striiformis]|uniref:MULE transposase domain-containing protein n=1 Tax=Puccinia striiformis TaxID=27350 RepID=A0A2S4W7K1_9BASI|nr:hypothetical protein PSHT_06314 [Puccinia striiformis]